MNNIYLIGVLTSQVGDDVVQLDVNGKSAICMYMYCTVDMSSTLQVVSLMS